MHKVERVKRAINFQGPDRIPLLLYNADLDKSDIIVSEVVNQFGNSSSPQSEWGFSWQKLDRTMGQPTEPLIRGWEDRQKLIVPRADMKGRFTASQELMTAYPDTYYLASLGLSGFAVMSSIRGFADSLTDIYLEPENTTWLAEIVFGFENSVISLLKDQGFHGVGFFDDWGTQQGLIINPEIWREIFKPRYREQFALVHANELDVYFHCCGQIQEIIPDLIEIGVDMLNISQPNVFDIEKLGQQFRGRICFVCPISYQTTSISGLRQDIMAEAGRLAGNLGCPSGGFIGYVEEYSSIGMSDENYRFCIEAFSGLKT